MAEIETSHVYTLFLDQDELELVANLLYSGPRLGHGYYSELAADLAETIASARGEIEHEDRLFDYGNEEGHVWVRTAP